MWPKAISMIAAGDLPMDDIISHTFPLSEFKKGIDQVDFFELKVLKCVFCFRFYLDKKVLK